MENMLENAFMLMEASFLLLPSLAAASAIAVLIVAAAAGPALTVAAVSLPLLVALLSLLPSRLSSPTALLLSRLLSRTLPPPAIILLLSLLLSRFLPPPTTRLLRSLLLSRFLPPPSPPATLLLSLLLSRGLSLVVVTLASFALFFAFSLVFGLILALLPLLPTFRVSSRSAPIRSILLLLSSIISSLFAYDGTAGDAIFFVLLSLVLLSLLLGLALVLALLPPLPNSSRSAPIRSILLLLEP
mmetsp:Transcript_8000/g.17315  ORF Transcript_8000/g.17315 Transcript_8000/m.17315 type:complete len:243 (-) Transcript_8000:615-1343(-)